METWLFRRRCSATLRGCLLDEKGTSFYCALLFVAALVPRFLFLGSKSTWADEAASFRITTMGWSDSLSFLVGYDLHGPLPVLLPRLLFVHAGSGLLQYRLLFALFGAAAVPLCFLLLREYYGRKASLLAAAIMCVSPLYLQLSQEARLYPLLLSVFLASTWCFTLWSKGKVGFWTFSLQYCVLGIIGVYTDVVPWLTVFFFHWLCGWYLGIPRRKILATLAIQGTCCLAYLPYVILTVRAARNVAYEMHLGGQATRIFSSLPGQLMMFECTAGRALHALFFPTTDYFSTFSHVLKTEPRFVLWTLFLAGCTALVATLRGAPWKRRPGPGFVLLTLVLVALGADLFLLSRGVERPLWFAGTFLIPLGLICSLIMVPLFYNDDPVALRRSVFALFIALPVLYGAKLLVPMDPRHFALSFVFLLGHLGTSIEILWKNTLGKTLVLLLAVAMTTSILCYYRSDVEIFHPQNFREACRATAALDGRGETVLVNINDWGAEAAVRFYLEGIGERETALEQWLGGKGANGFDLAMLPGIEQTLSRREKVYVLTLRRFESDYYAFMRALADRYRLVVTPFGEEVLLVEVSRREKEVER